jgi:predicted transcriptional regulator
MSISDSVTQIVTAYISCNRVAAEHLPFLINMVHNALCRHVLGASFGGAEPRPASTERRRPRRPAMPIIDTIKPDYLVCLEDGRRMKSLKRHLSVAHGLSVEQYAERWDLPTGYPMVAPNYSALLSQHAKGMRLGHGKHKRRFQQK